MKIVYIIGVVWMVNVFFGGSGFGWERVVGEFLFKSSISSVSTSGCFC